MGIRTLRVFNFLSKYAMLHLKAGCGWGLHARKSTCATLAQSPFSNSIHTYSSHIFRSCTLYRLCAATYNELQCRAFRSLKCSRSWTSDSCTIQEYFLAVRSAKSRPLIPRMPQQFHLQQVSTFALYSYTHLFPRITVTGHRTDRA